MNCALTLKAFSHIYLSGKVKWPILTLMEQRNIIFPQGGAANIVNNSIIYHIMLFFYILGTPEKKERAVSVWWFCPELLTARVRQGALSKYLTDLGLDFHGDWRQPCGSDTQNY